MNKLLGLCFFSISLLFFSCSKSSSASSGEDARDPGVFSYNIITPTPNDPSGVFQLGELGTLTEPIRVRMFLEDNFIKLTARCSHDSGSFYLNLNSPIERQTIVEESGRTLYSVRFLKETRAKFTQGEMTCRFGFDAGDRLVFYFNELNGGILESPSPVLTVRIERDFGNNVLASESSESFINLSLFKISD